MARPLKTLKANATDRCMFARPAEQAKRPARIPLRDLARSCQILPDHACSATDEKWQRSPRLQLWSFSLNLYSSKWCLTCESFKLQAGITVMLSTAQNSVQSCTEGGNLPLTYHPTQSEKKSQRKSPDVGHDQELTSDIPSGSITYEKRPTVRPALLACSKNVAVLVLTGELQHCWDTAIQWPKWSKNRSKLRKQSRPPPNSTNPCSAPNPHRAWPCFSCPVTRPTSNF